MLPSGWRLSHRNREWPEAEDEDEQGQDGDHDPPGAQGFDYGGGGMRHAHHDCQENCVEKAAGAVVQNETQYS
jgi:hypothetical protein